ncbi:MAG: flagellar protein FliT [Betaproteobacteria bacterium]|nr:flagellar protein FliT [Betaproteobacteria bacterium]
MPSQIEIYEEMRLLSSRMVAAARARDWDHLIELERGVGSLRQALQAAPDDGADTDLRRKRRLIQRILDDDAEVRRHTEPWMERIRHFLGDNERLHELQKACAADAGDTTADGCRA